MCVLRQDYLSVMTDEERESVYRALSLGQPVRLDYFDVLRWEQKLILKQWSLDARFKKSMSKSLIRYDHAKQRQSESNH
jgi:hypothetical protein